MNVYFIPGLGADWRTFEKLKLNNSLSTKYIQWESPFENETISGYAIRLAGQIDKNQRFSLVGLSFGGVIAYEIAKVLNPENVIIISSFKPGNVPGVIKFLRFIKLHYLLPYKLVKSPNKVTYRIFGAQSDDDRKLLDRIMKDADIGFFKWAMKAMLNYKPEQLEMNAIHIHGTCDRIIPLKYVSPDVTIKQGTHFMVYNMAEIISEELNLILLRE